MSQELNQIEKEIRQLQVLVRVNNLLLSKFILQLSETRKELGLPKRQSFFKFEILQEDVDELIKEFGKDETIKALYRLDRLLLQNKQNCPHNIKKYIRNRLRRKTNDRTND
jgi:hypothetical protein